RRRALAEETYRPENDPFPHSRLVT
ncbi:hypothetical protein NPIL_88211, partial [Nephila pilipes]